MLLADTNGFNIASANAMGLPTFFGSLLSDRSDDQVRLAGIGRLIALTSNDEANALTALKYAREFGRANVYQIAPKGHEGDPERLGGERRGLWLSSERLSFNRLRDLHEHGAEFESRELSDEYTLADYMNEQGESAVPLFLRNGKALRIISERTDPNREQSGTVIALVER